MCMIAIRTQTERKPQDRSVRRAEKSRCRARMMGAHGPICPPSAGPAEVDNARGTKHLFSRRNRAILPSSGTPLGECRLKGFTPPFSATGGQDSALLGETKSQSHPLMPISQAFVRILVENLVPLAQIRCNPTRLACHHDMRPQGRLRQVGVNCPGVRMHQLRPARIPQPQRRPAISAKAALAGLSTISPVASAIFDR